MVAKSKADRRFRSNAAAKTVGKTAGRGKSRAGKAESEFVFSPALKQPAHLATEVISEIDPAFQSVLSEIYGLDGGEPRSIDDIAVDLDTDPDTVKTIQTNALRFLMGYGRRKPWFFRQQ